MRGNIIASIAVFQSLYNTDQDIYSVLARFVTAAINRQNLWSFDITTLRNLLKEDFGIEDYDSVLKTVIKQRLKDSIKKSDNGNTIKGTSGSLQPTVVGTGGKISVRF